MLAAAEAVAALWQGEFGFEPPALAASRGVSGEADLDRAMHRAEVPVLDVDPERTWLWSDLHLGDRAVLSAWNRPFRDVDDMASRRSVPSGWARSPGHRSAAGRKGARGATGEGPRAARRRPERRRCGRRAGEDDVTGRPTAGGGDVVFVEATRMAGSGALTLTGRQGEVVLESVRTALSWLRANAGRYGLDPVFHRDTDVHLHVQSGAGPTEGASAGVTMVAAPASAFRGRPVRGDLAMTGEITLSGQVLPGRSASRRRCSPRTGAGWRASSCRGRTRSRSTRTSATTFGAWSKSTTSRRSTTCWSWRSGRRRRRTMRRRQCRPAGCPEPPVARRRATPGTGRPSGPVHGACVGWRAQSRRKGAPASSRVAVKRGHAGRPGSGWRRQIGGAAVSLRGGSSG